VVVLRWPAERRRRDELRDIGAAVVLLVEAASPPPATLDCLEDWVRLPASDGDVQARIRVLEARSRLRRHEPELGEDGVLRVGERRVVLPPVEARLAGVLLERPGVVVSREALARAGWAQGLPGRNALDVHMMRLRRRMAGTGLAIRTVRSRGYLLERSASVQPYVREA
jgi:DNA-binding response OmpR family regulator